jgi:glycine/D-amino acid oxidase-like deaminating enzyme
MNRRDFLGGMAVVGLSGCARKTKTAVALPSLPSYDVVPKLMPIRAHVDRIFRVTVCLRPFRAAGPRLEVERVGDKIVVHNYGHGGSGWSLSWGSSSMAVEKAMAAGERDVAVIGCGALGLTSAILLQRAGAKVTIYAKESAGGSIRASDRILDARFTDRFDERCVTRFSSALGEDVPQLVSYL